jgi:hypothetical protein
MIAFKAMFSEVTSGPTSRLVFGSRPVSYIIKKDFGLHTTAALGTGYV